MIEGLPFASCYVYSPAGADAVSVRSRQLRTLLKAGDGNSMFRWALRVRQQVTDRSPLAGYLRPDQWLVPVPGSARTAGGCSVSWHIANALIDEGLGRFAWQGLRRVRAVRKSATAAPGSRPTVENHYDSFAVESAAARPSQVVLIDDVVTKGRTLLAAAARLREAFPDADIRAFALLRTMGLARRIDHLLDPCIGEIRWRGGDAVRNP
jgi:hypothetical protein